MSNRAKDESDFFFRTYETVVLDVLKLSLQQAVDGRAFHAGNARFDVLRCDAERLVMRMTCSLAAGAVVVEDREVVSYPVDWWEAVKARWFPRWWLRRWPARFERRVVRSETRRVCPHVECGPRNARHVEFLLSREGNRDG